jgi:hypothetical protein
MNNRNIQCKAFKVFPLTLIEHVIGFICRRMGLKDGQAYILATQAGITLDTKKRLADYGFGVMYQYWCLELKRSNLNTSVNGNRSLQYWKRFSYNLLIMKRRESCYKDYEMCFNIISNVIDSSVKESENEKSVSSVSSTGPTASKTESALDKVLAIISQKEISEKVLCRVLSMLENQDRVTDLSNAGTESDSVSSEDELSIISPAPVIEKVIEPIITEPVKRTNAFANMLRNQKERLKSVPKEPRRTNMSNLAETLILSMKQKFRCLSEEEVSDLSEVDSEWSD